MVWLSEFVPVTVMVEELPLKLAGAVTFKTAFWVSVMTCAEVTVIGSVGLLVSFGISVLVVNVRRHDPFRTCQSH